MRTSSERELGVARENEEVRFGRWAERIRDADAKMSHRYTEWNRYLRHYRMSLSDAESPTGEAVWVNHFFGLARVILPSIYYRNPEVLVSPGPQTAPISAKIKELLLNYQLQELGFEWEARKSIFDALFFGIGLVKMGFAPRLQKVTQRDLEESALAEMFGLEEESEEYDQRVSDKLPFILNVSPKHFRIDPLATCAENARWMAFQVWKPVDEVRESKDYARSVASTVQATHDADDDEALGNAASSPALYPEHQPRKEGLVRLDEIWDFENRKWYVMDSYHRGNGEKKFLREEDWPYPIDGFPAELLVFNPDPESVYGVPDAGTWLNPSNTINLLRTLRFNHVLKANRKIGVRKGAIPEEELKKMTSPDDLAVFFTNEDPAVAWRMMEDLNIPTDLYNLEDAVRSDMIFLSGVTEQRSRLGEKAKTATEASIIENQARVRDSDRLYIVEKWVTRVVKKLHQLDQLYLSPDYVAFLTIPEAFQLWSTPGASEEVMRADVDVRLRVGSSAYYSREVRVKQQLDFLNITQGDPNVNRPALLRRIAESMDLDSPNEILNPQPMFTLEQAAQILTASGTIGPGTLGTGSVNKPSQDTARRTGSTNLGDQLSGVQNLGVRRNPPNPTVEGARS
jgi:hypothetical protein